MKRVKRYILLENEDSEFIYRGKFVTVGQAMRIVTKSGRKVDDFLMLPVWEESE